MTKPILIYIPLIILGKPENVFALFRIPDSVQFYPRGISSQFRIRKILKHSLSREQE